MDATTGEDDGGNLGKYPGGMAGEGAGVGRQRTRDAEQDTTRDLGTKVGVCANKLLFLHYRRGRMTGLEAGSYATGAV